MTTRTCPGAGAGEKRPLPPTVAAMFDYTAAPVRSGSGGTEASHRRSVLTKTLQQRRLGVS